MLAAVLRPARARSSSATAAVSAAACRACAVLGPYAHTATMSSAAGSYTDKVQRLIDNNEIMVFSKTTCGYCSRAKSLLNQVANGKTVTVLELDTLSDGSQYQDALAKLTGRRTVPNIFIKRKNVGGCDDLHALHAAGKLTAML